MELLQVPLQWQVFDMQWRLTAHSCDVLQSSIRGPFLSNVKWGKTVWKLWLQSSPNLVPEFIWNVRGYHGTGEVSNTNCCSPPVSWDVLRLSYSSHFSFKGQELECCIDLPCGRRCPSSLVPALLQGPASPHAAATATLHSARLILKAYTRIARSLLAHRANSRLLSRVLAADINPCSPHALQASSLFQWALWPSAITE